MRLLLDCMTLCLDGPSDVIFYLLPSWDPSILRWHPARILCWHPGGIRCCRGCIRELYKEVRLHTKWCDVSSSVLHAPQADLEVGLGPQKASAMRLLYAALQPLEEDPSSLRYAQSFMGFDARVRERVCIYDVLKFLRMALEVPDEEFLVLMPMCDDAQLAEGTFGTETHKEVRPHQPALSHVYIISGDRDALAM